MKKSALVWIALIAMLMMVAASGCVPLGANRTTVMSGGIYTDVSLPNDAHMEASANPTKTGTASCKSILFLVAWGDCSVDAAMKAGKMSKVHHVDNEFTNILFVYTATKTVAYGE